MITSMTGYGDAQGSLFGIELTVELRCLNNRYYKPTIRLPEEFSQLEADVDALMRKAVSRGTLVYTLRTKPAEDSAQVQINYPVLRSFLQDLREMERDLGFEGLNIDLANLLQMPGLTHPAVLIPEQQERLKELILELSRQALANLAHMRSREGQVLHDDLMAQSKSIRKHLGGIAQAAPGVVKSYQTKLNQRVSELLSGTRVSVTEDDLAREIAIFAERCDISEEVVRLGSHLDHFDNVCRETSQAGRRLDFIAQEMLREANTIGAKASDAEICAAVVDVKTAIDRIKEQVQNVE